MQPGGFLTGFERDLITVSGLIGIIVAIVQILRIGSVASATKRAVFSTLGQARGDFGQFVLGSGTRLLSEAKIFVEQSDWERAAMRCGDLVEMAAQLGRATPPGGAVWQQVGIKFSEWESTCRRVAGGELKANRNLMIKWHNFAAEAGTEFASHRGPFSAQGTGQAKEVER